MKIIFTIGRLGGGGAERVVSVLANSFIEYGHEVNIITLSENDKPAYPLKNNVKRISIIKDKNENKIRYFKRIRKTIIELNPSVVISFLTYINVYILISLIFSGIKVIVSERNDPKYSPERRLMRVLRKFTYVFASGYVFQTKKATEYFSKRIRRNSIIIKNPISNLIPRPKPKCKKDIIAVGRLTRQKNYIMLLNAYKKIYKKIPDYRLSIYGEGEERYNIEKYILENNLQDNVILMGQVSDIYNKINGSSLFVMASDIEGMPNALIEAMALGIPSICTNCNSGGPAELITNFENGILVEVGNEEELANAIMLVLNDNNISERISKNSIKIREELDIDVITKQWLDYCKKVSGGNRRTI